MRIAVDALLIACTLLATAFINIRLPIGGNGGLIHLGNVPLFVAAVIFGKRSGAIAGAVGMGLFDVLSGWTLWAPFTFVIVGTIGFTVGLIFEKAKKHFTLLYIIAIFSALAIKIIGYYIAEAILYGNLLIPIASIPGNILQIVFGGIIAAPIIAALKRIFAKENVQ